jgi:phosphoribosylformylglycinamidine (FGAM) synthase-like amidotransferase family enzyme
MGASSFHGPGPSPRSTLPSPGWCNGIQYLVTAKLILSTLQAVEETDFHANWPPLVVQPGDAKKAIHGDETGFSEKLPENTKSFNVTNRSHNLGSK